MSSDNKLLDRLLSDKINLLREQIQDIKNEIHLRKRLAKKAITEIDEQICKVRTLIYELNVNGTLRGKRADLEREILILEREKHNQKIQCWKDIERLKRELRQVKKEYKEVVRKASVASTSSRRFR